MGREAIYTFSCVTKQCVASGRLRIWLCTGEAQSSLNGLHWAPRPGGSLERTSWQLSEPLPNCKMIAKSLKSCQGISSNDDGDNQGWTVSMELNARFCAEARNRQPQPQGFCENRHHDFMTTIRRLQNRAGYTTLA